MFTVQPRADQRWLYWSGKRVRRSLRHSPGLLGWKVTRAGKHLDIHQIDMGTDERAEDKRAENGALLLENEDEFEEFEVDGASRNGHLWCEYHHDGI